MIRRKPASHHRLSDSVKVADVVVVEGDADTHRTKLFSATGVSVLVHFVLFLGLSFLILPVTVGGNIILMMATFRDEQQLEFDVSNSFEVDVDSVDHVVEQFTAARLVETTELPEIDFVPPEIQLSNSSTEPLHPAADIVDVSPSGRPTSADASSVESAVDGITANIVGELEKGDLLVVWLLDSSHSLVDDRKRVAARLEPFFEEIAARTADGTIHQLQNAVVSFGKTTKQRVAPTKFGKQVVGAVEKMPVDSSGKENVFAAVAKTVADYRYSWREKQLMIVVWTDESGDDVDLLESTIANCRKHRASVLVVGPSSVLGAETGLHSYVDPKRKTLHQLPVTRGPDTPFPERIELGYWFHSGQGFPLLVTGDGNNPAWYGGPDLKGIASGFSPYALTRLAAQTGGFYTIFDRPEDSAPFDRQALQAYAPAYRAADKYFADVARHPLRRAVIDAVKVVSGKGMSCPELMLFVDRDRKFPAQFDRPYYTPKQFFTKLRASRRSLERKANRMTLYVEQALVCVSKAGQVDQPLDYEYDAEKLPRWRAWYDLTRGRLLATSVRLEEYRLTLDAISQTGALKSTTNHVLMFPSSNLRSDDAFQSRAEEAERLLRRCVDNNPKTPWATLAQRELDRQFGINAEQLALTPTPLGPGRVNPSLPRF